jgi:hypothetical protein
LTLGADFAEASDGSSTAAWVGTNDVLGASQAMPVQVQRAAPDGTLSAAQTLGAASTACGCIAGPTAALATSSTGLTAVAWVGIADDPSDTDLKVHVTLLNAAGAEVYDAVAASVPDGAKLPDGVDVAVDASGDATVVWVQENTADTGVKAVHLAANGTPGTPADSPIPLSPDGLYPHVAMADGGVAWVVWEDANDEVARLNSDGTLDRGGLLATSLHSDSLVRVTAGANGAVATWSETDSDGSHVRGARLPLSGDLVDGATFHTEPVPALFSGFDASIGPDGTVTVVWNSLTLSLDDPSAPATAATVSLSRFIGTAATAPAVPLLSPTNLPFNLFPAIASAPDGSSVVSWLTVADLPSSSLPQVTIAAQPIASDGSLGTASNVTDYIPSLTSPPDPGMLLQPQADNIGGGTLALVSPGFGGPSSLQTFVLDTTAPQATVTVQATAVVGTPVRMSAAVSDPRGVASVWWDFGDDSGSRRAAVNHVYGVPGTYQVTLTATDTYGNETVVTRQLTVTAPGEPARPGTTKPAAAGLRVARATRRGAIVTVSGTIARSAIGRVTISYAQRVGRKTIKVKATAKIAKGRWSAKVRLPRSITSARTARGRSLKPVVTVTYAGNKAIAKASAKRTVTTAKAKPKHRAAKHKKH